MRTDQANDPSPSGLKAAAPFPIGTAVDLDQVLRNQALLDLHLTHFSSITAENDMKMFRVAPTPDGLDFSAPDRMLAFAQTHGLRLFGHTLIWHSGTPEWVRELAADPAALDGFMKAYIHAYVGRYRGKVAAWDVVNEAINTSGGGYRRSPWYQALGEAYLAKAFRYAHEADPAATLFYNDFNLERDSRKLDSALSMIASLKEQGAPISGLGFQMHLQMEVADELIADALGKGAATGLQIHLSEVDLIFNSHNDSPGGGVQTHSELSDAMRQQQGEKYRRLVELYRSLVPPQQQYGITFWGTNDSDSWIRDFFGITDWPCLFDENLQPKPAYFGTLEGLKTDPSRFET